MVTKGAERGTGPATGSSQVWCARELLCSSSSNAAAAEQDKRGRGRERNGEVEMG